MKWRRWYTVLLAAPIAVAIAIDFSGAYQTETIPPPIGISSRQTTEFEWSDSAIARDTPYVRPVLLQYLASLPPGAKVLDLGCGNGYLLGTFRDRGWQLTGADISASGLEQARRAQPGIRFVQADATGDVGMLGLGAYDAVISTEVIEHIFLPRLFAGNAYRLLKPGGVLVLSTPFNGYLKTLALAASGRFVDRYADPLADFGHIKFWSPNTLSHLLYENGFESVEWRGTGALPHIWKYQIMKARKPSTAATSATVQLRR